MLRDKITVSFSDILTQTQTTHEQLIQALTAEIKSGFQSAEANEHMVVIIILAGLEHLKLNNQLANTNNEVCAQLLNLTGCTGNNQIYWIQEKEILVALNLIDRSNSIPLSARQLLESLLVLVCEKKLDFRRGIEGADCTKIFQNHDLQTVMTHIHSHFSEERLKKLRRREPDSMTIVPAEVPTGIQGNRTTAENLVAHSAIVTRHPSSAPSVETTAAAASSSADSSNVRAKAPSNS